MAYRKACQHLPGQTNAKGPEPSMVFPICIPSSQEVEAGASKVQSGLRSSYLVSLYLQHLGLRRLLTALFSVTTYS